MLRIIEKPSPRKLVMSPGQKVSRKYKIAQQKRLIKRREYKKLKAIVPSVSKKNKVPKITVIEEAIKYIDELHVALAKRMHLLSGISPAYLPYQITPNMLAPVFPFPQPRAHQAAVKPATKPLQLSGVCNTERRR
ncbi:hypothetical protein LSH36_128g03000 [Paralvinella palmiformis]|uniref:BHLH domain-containing protein n=1 Tax=Paralvinella palmiformis TaxID=53620 RepID=A0AAD9NA57_9ANNE|nr:hypothetical protein LSH36_128g03000 [Paralvinella palmiformis]